jgi:NAD(P)-dependent dehydrogenase (short-subunit alcohol dehydrogenase family)
MPNSRFDLTGKIALVTGGSKGLGKAMARGLAEAGADVAISSRREEELRPALDAILTGTGRKGCYLVADMSQRDQTKQLAKQVIERMGRVDILINNAGSNKVGPVDTVSDTDWDTIMELNLNSIMTLTRALAPGMKARRWGRIIHISSIMGYVSKEGRNIYSATKTALIGLARSEALDLGPFNVTVNCLAPGPFLTDLPAKMLSEAEKQEFARRTALGRWGDPQELVGPALFLASDAASYVTGTTLVIDGGYLAR